MQTSIICSSRVLSTSISYQYLGTPPSHHITTMKCKLPCFTLGAWANWPCAHTAPLLTSATTRHISIFHRETAFMSLARGCKCNSSLLFTSVIRGCFSPTSCHASVASHHHDVVRCAIHRVLPLPHGQPCVAYLLPLYSSPVWLGISPFFTSTRLPVSLHVSPHAFLPNFVWLFTNISPCSAHVSPTVFGTSLFSGHWHIVLSGVFH